tara:strand:- start:54 stop:551 length:498 start_codon:yes stop_codon:yes gene_type:complete
MADQLQFRGDTETNTDHLVGAQREVTVDTTHWNLRVHDGITPGGHALVKKTEVGNPVTIIAPFAQAFIKTNDAGTGTGCTWGAYDSGTGDMAITFNAAQPNTDYGVIRNREMFDSQHMIIKSKTVNGFTIEWADTTGTSPLDPYTFPGTFVCYASDPTYTVNVTA